MVTECRVLDLGPAGVSAAAAVAVRRQDPGRPHVGSLRLDAGRRVAQARFGRRRAGGGFFRSEAAQLLRRIARVAVRGGVRLQVRVVGVGGRRVLAETAVR